jgi:hypothetical protein
LEKGKKPKPTVAPGQYTFTDQDAIVNNGADITIDNVTGPFWIIVHGVVCELTCSCTDEPFNTLSLGTESIASVVKKSAEITNINLSTSDLKVYPNPFSDKVMFEFTSNVDAHAVLEITNLLGQKIKTLIDQPVREGVRNSVEFEPQGQVSGIYIYRLYLDDNVQIGKLIYNKE